MAGNVAKSMRCRLSSDRGPFDPTLSRPVLSAHARICVYVRESEQTTKSLMVATIKTSSLYFAFASLFYFNTCKCIGNVQL